MGLRINSDNPLLANNLNKSHNRIRETMERLASGNRINQAADDAAGLAIAEGLRAQLQGAQVETRNMQSGISMIQTAEGGLEQTTGALQRLRELALQASNGTLTDAQRAAINEEAQQMVSQINETAQNTEFNGTTLLNGTGGTVALGAGTNIEVELPNATAGGLGVSEIDLGTQAGAEAAVANIDAALATVTEQRSGFGATQNAIESAIRNRETETENLMAARAAIREANIAAEITRLAQSQILEQSGMSVLAQSNIQAENALRLLVD